MMVEISRSLLHRIEAAAAAAPGYEACGLLFGSAARIDGERAAANVAADPACRFEIDPAALIAAHRAARAGGPPLAGCWHSHPSGRAWPSATDAALAAADGWLWLIVGSDGTAAFRAVPRGRIAGRFEAVDLRPTAP